MTTPSETAIKLACERAGLEYDEYCICRYSFDANKAILAHACDIERLEPHLCVDPVRAEAERIRDQWENDEIGGVVDAIELGIRRGMEMKA